MEDEWHRCGDKHKTKKSNPRTVLFIIQRASISRFIFDIVSGIISLCSGRNSMSRRILFVLFVEPTACVCACACVRCIRHAIHQKKMTRNKTVCMLFYLFSESVHPIKMIKPTQALTIKTKYRTICDDDDSRKCPESLRNTAHLCFCAKPGCCIVWDQITLVIPSLFRCLSHSVSAGTISRSDAIANACLNMQRQSSHIYIYTAMFAPAEHRHTSYSRSTWCRMHRQTSTNSAHTKDTTNVSYCIITKGKQISRIVIVYNIAWFGLKHISIGWNVDVASFFGVSLYFLVLCVFPFENWSFFFFVVFANVRVLL